MTQQRRLAAILVADVVGYSKLIDFGTRGSLPGKANHLALCDRLHSVGNESDEARSAGIPDRRIDNAVVARCPDSICEAIARRVALGGIGVQVVRPRTDVAKVHEVPNKACKHLRILNDCVEVADVGKFALHVECHFDNACSDGERGIPGPSPGTVKAILGTRQPIREGGIDEMRMRDSERQLAPVQMIGADFLRPQSAASGAFDFRKGP